jgi:hypothetical protein
MISCIKNDQFQGYNGFFGGETGVLGGVGMARANRHYLLVICDWGRTLFNKLICHKLLNFSVPIAAPDYRRDGHLEHICL